MIRVDRAGDGFAGLVQNPPAELELGIFLIKAGGGGRDFERLAGHDNGVAFVCLSVNFYFGQQRPALLWIPARPVMAEFLGNGGGAEFFFVNALHIALRVEKGAKVGGSLQGAGAPQEHGRAETTRRGVYFLKAVTQVVQFGVIRLLVNYAPGGFVPPPRALRAQLGNIVGAAPLRLEILAGAAHGTLAVAVVADHIQVRGILFNEGNFVCGRVDHRETGQLFWEALVQGERHAIDGFEVGRIQRHLIAQAPHQNRRMIANTTDGFLKNLDLIVAFFAIVPVPGGAVLALIFALMRHPDADDDLESQTLVVIKLRARRRYVSAEGVGAVGGGQIEPRRAANALDLKTAKHLVTGRAGGIR